MNTIKPTIQRMVLVQTEDTNGRPVTLPAIVTRVHSDQCVDVVAFSGSTDIASLMPGGTKPMTSLVYDENQSLNTWRWNEFQKGQASRTDTVEKEIAARLDAMEKELAENKKRQVYLEATIAALNAKQPERQRLPVVDATPVADAALAGNQPHIALLSDKQPEPQDLPAGHPDLLTTDGGGGEGLRG